MNVYMQIMENIEKNAIIFMGNIYICTMQIMENIEKNIIILMENIYVDNGKYREEEY